VHRIGANDERPIDTRETKKIGHDRDRAEHREEHHDEFGRLDGGYAFDGKIAVSLEYERTADDREYRSLEDDGESLHFSESVGKPATRSFAGNPECERIDARDEDVEDRKSVV
jgi:hypothetical protein